MREVALDGSVCTPSLVVRGRRRVGVGGEQLVGEAQESESEEGLLPTRKSWLRRCCRCCCRRERKSQLVNSFLVVVHRS